MVTSLGITLIVLAVVAAIGIVAISVAYAYYLKKRKYWVQKGMPADTGQAYSIQHKKEREEKKRKETLKSFGINQ